MPNIEQDAYGKEISAYWQSLNDPDATPPFEIIERDDGWIGASVHTPKMYFSDYDSWPKPEQEAIQHAVGRVLDVGCGAGRVGLYLQERGHQVVGIDTSPLALEVCGQRGLTDLLLMSITQISSKLGRFDTIVMFGNNFGLFGNPKRARYLLKRFYSMTSPQGGILSTSRDIYKTSDPLHLAYHDRNRKRGRMPGQIRLRVRYQTIKSPWFDYLMVSPDELADIIKDTGWQVTRIYPQDEDSIYSALIEKISGYKPSI